MQMTVNSGVRGILPSVVSLLWGLKFLSELLTHPRVPESMRELQEACGCFGRASGTDGRTTSSFAHHESRLFHKLFGLFV